MPEFRTPKDFNMHEIGIGNEKVVYGDEEPVGDGSDLVLKVDNKSEFAADLYGYQKMPEYVKAGYYLSKILHVLMPESIPDLYSAAVTPNKLDEKEVDIQTLHERKFFKKVLRDGNLDNDFFDHKYKIKREALEAKFLSLGLNFEPKAPMNFEVDHQDHDNLIYVDAFYPIEFVEGDSKRGFDHNALFLAIENMEDKAEYEHCRNYFTRMNQLLTELEEKVVGDPGLLKNKSDDTK